MAPVPKKKSTRSRSGKRAGTKKFSMPSFSPCPNCKKPKAPHVACGHCGYYK